MERHRSDDGGAAAGAENDGDYLQTKHAPRTQRRQRREVRKRKARHSSTHRWNDLVSPSFDPLPQAFEWVSFFFPPYKDTH